MDSLEQVTADCEALAKALKARTLPKEKRKPARAVLQRAFLIQSAEPVDHDALAEVGLDLADLLDRKPVPEWEPLAFRLERMWPIRIREAVRPEFMERLMTTYMSTGDRLEEIVEWFWARCEPDEQKARKKSVAEMATEQFGDTEMEYVWGRVRRGPPR